MVRLCAVLAVGMLIAGCGYAPMSSAGALPSDVRTLYVDADEGPRGDPELADALERALRRVIRRDGFFSLAATPTSADAVLRVDLAASVTRPVAFDQYDDPLDYETTVTVNAKLSTSTGIVVWGAKDLGATRAHAAAAGAVVTSSSAFLSSERLRPRDLGALDTVQLGEQRLTHARQQLAADLASAIYLSMTEGR
jgi:outer membrane lipopolysaccharide assembly protein LptE/RlpB